MAFSHAVRSEALRLFSRQAPQGVQDGSGDQNIGSAQQTEPTSASQLYSTFLPVFVVAVVWFVLFLILRRVFPRKYSPRSFLAQLRPEERSRELPNGLFNWFGAFFSLPDTDVLRHQSLDGYLFLRLLKLGTISCLVGSLITMPILFPINATGGGGQQQLDILSMANVSDELTGNSNTYYRYLAHTFCAYVFFGFILFLITRESIFYINLRQAFLLSPIYAERMSSRTVLYTSVPEYYLNEQRLRTMLGNSVRRIWIPTDVKELEELVSERDKLSLKLEGAETKLGKLANAARLKAVKKGNNHDQEEAAVTDQESSGSVASRWIASKQRPTHKLKLLIGKKVDTIDYSRTRLAEIIPQIREQQNQHREVHTDVKKLNSVFVEFDSVGSAQAAFQSLTHHQILHMAPRYTGINPEEVIWKNLRIKWWERIMRVFATTAFVTALVIFWSIPVAFVGAISNVTYLTSIPGLGWLSFINSVPQAIRGVITGLLPVILLAVLMALLPIILRFVARLSGDPTLSAVELTVQNYYFAFQVVQVFLVATLSSSAAAAIDQIRQDPASVTTLLSSSIPKASNFYVSYFILQGFGVVAGLLVGLVGLIIAIVLSKILDTTPRKMYKRWTTMAGLGWGTVFPIYTNLWVITICYAIVAPLVLGFATIGMYLFYLAYRYNFLFVYNVNIDTQGLVYPRALQHLFVGLYISEICIIGLFAIKAGTIGGVISLVLMIILLIFTALYHLSLNSALGPLLAYLPKSLEAEERSLLSAERGLHNGAHDGVHNGVTNGATNGAERAVNKDAILDGVPDETNGHSKEGALPAAPHKKPNFLTKFLKPHIYNDYATMRRMVPRDFVNVEYPPEVERDAYYHPCVKSEPMLLWIPRDSMGVSAQEVRHTSKVIPITDEGATLDEKNKIVWDGQKDVAPIHEEKIYY